MTDTLVEARPRKRDAAATRARILAAAMDRFARLGYETASLREIAAEAGVDVALIGRYFGGKEGLFTEALKASIHPNRLRDHDRESYVRAVAENMANGPKDGESDQDGFQFLLRAATSPATAPLLNLAVQERFLGPIRDWLGGEDAEPRARVMAGVIIGFLVERLIRGKALRGREREVFIERASAILTALVSENRS
ncbi:MAG TPA: TetR family transcriptional regulator [Caulobacteraceae bacterium]|nr:TetR family transcriptional regulator [Caulobacteraceae bacterium]